MIRLLPVGVEVIAGGLDGVLRQNDSNNGRTAIQKQYATWYEAALTLAGAGLGMFRYHPDVWEPLLYGGLYGLASKTGQYVMAKQSGSTTTSGWVHAPMAMTPAWSGRDLYSNRNQPVGILG